MRMLAPPRGIPLPPRFVPVFFAALALVCRIPAIDSLQAARESAPPPPACFLQVEHIDLPVEAATRIARKAVTSTDPSAAWTEMEAELKAGRAVRVASTGLATDPDESGKAAGVVDYVYATDCTSPETPSWVGSALLGNKVPITITTPTNLEIRPVGTRLEVDCTWAGSRPSLDAEFKTYLTDAIGSTASGHGVSTTWHPKFHERAAEGMVSLGAASWRLFGMAVPPSAPGPERRTLVWLRRDDLPAPAPRAPKAALSNNRMILFEVYELPAETATALIDAWRAAPATICLRDRVAEAVDQGQGRVLATASGQIAAGSAAAVQSARDSIVPTEMDPPELPNRVSGVFIHPEKIATEINATAFDITPLGFEARLLDTADPSTLMPRYSLSVTWTDLDLDVALGDIPGRVLHPYFRKAELSTTCPIPFDQPTLVLLASPPARTSPPPEVRRTEKWKDMPTYQTNATPRVLVFLTVSPMEK